jgi:putative membrane protein
VIVALVVYTVLALVTPAIFPKVKIKTPLAALGVAMIFGLLNFAIGWLLKSVLAVVSLPVAFLLPGVISLAVPTLANAALLKVTDGIVSGFEIDGWLPAIGMGFVFSLGGLVL